MPPICCLRRERGGRRGDEPRSRRPAGALEEEGGRELPTARRCDGAALGRLQRRRRCRRSAVCAGSEGADAVMNRDHGALQALLKKKADVNAPQRDGATALHWAVYNDDADAADLLLRAGAKPNVANRTGMTPLAMAALYGSTPLIGRPLKVRAGAQAV